MLPAHIVRLPLDIVSNQRQQFSTVYFARGGLRQLFYKMNGIGNHVFWQMGTDKGFDLSSGEVGVGLGHNCGDQTMADLLIWYG